jgi:superfamily II DNA or RNA helicase
MASMAEDFYNFHGIEIRDYQEKAIQDIKTAWKNPEFRRVMFQMPTGTGKTVVFNQIVKQELEKNSTVLIVAHRGELVRQNLERLREHFGIEAGIIMGNHCTNPSLPVQVATIQTLDNRDYSWLNPSLIIIDEAHHVPAQSYVRLLNKHQKAKILGVTATPIRLNGEGFIGLFDKLITSKSIKEFIKDGYLADIQYIGRNQIWSKLDLSSISTNNTGDYDPNQLSRMMRQDFVMADLVKSYVKYAQGKKMIVFAVDIEHSKDIVKRYEEAGFKAAHLDGKTKKPERKEIINKFKSGEIQILSNFDIVSEGFDVPDCEVVQLARPTKSLVVYLQQIGRCMRPSETKTHCVVLDNVGLRQEFRSPKDDRPWKLEATKDNSAIISPNSRPFEAEFTRTNPEEIDEDLVVLEDVIKSKTIFESLAEIDDELTELAEISIESSHIQDIISVLRTVKDNIVDFLNLHLYRVLGNVPNPLSIPHFVASKDNPLKIAGKEDLFRQCDFVADFTLPTKFDKPIKPVKPDPFTDEEKETYWEALEAYIEWDDSNELKVNLLIDKLKAELLKLDIVRKYQNLQRAIEFVESHDPSEFENDEELDLWELPEPIRTKILGVYQAIFKASPTLIMIGKTVNLLEVDPNCSLDSIQGIDTILAVQDQHKGSKFGFIRQDELVQVIDLVKSELNVRSLVRLVRCLDTCYGSYGASKNSTMVLNNLKMLLGVKPRKRSRD